MASAIDTSSEQFSVPRSTFSDIPEEGIGLSDYAHRVASGVYGVAGSVAGAVDYLGQGKIEGWRGVRDWAERGQTEHMEDMSPGAQRAMRAKTLPGDGPTIWDSDVSTGHAIGLRTAEALPSLIASMIPGGLVARYALAAGAGVEAAATAGTLAGGVAGGVQSGGDLFNQIMDGFQKEPDAQLQETSEVYRGLRGMGMSEKDAKEQIGRQSAGYKPLVMAAITALTSRYGVESMVAHRAAGEAGKGVARSAAIGALGEASQEAIEGASGELLAQHAIFDAKGGAGNYDWQKALEAAASGALVGGITGGAVGGVSGRRRGVTVGADVEPAIGAALNDAPMAAPVEAPIPQGVTSSEGLNAVVDKKLARVGEEMALANERVAKVGGVGNGAVVAHVPEIAPNPNVTSDIAADEFAALHDPELGENINAELDTEPPPPATAPDVPAGIPLVPQVPVVASPLAEVIGASAVSPQLAPERAAAPALGAPATGKGSRPGRTKAAKAQRDAALEALQAKFPPVQVTPEAPALGAPATGKGSRPGRTKAAKAQRDAALEALQAKFPPVQVTPEAPAPVVETPVEASTAPSPVQAPVVAPEPVKATPGAAVAAPRVLEATTKLIERKAKSAAAQIAKLRKANPEITASELARQVKIGTEVREETFRDRPRDTPLKRMQREAGVPAGQELGAKEFAKKQLDDARAAVAARTDTAIKEATFPAADTNNPKAIKAYAQELVSKADLGGVKLANLPASADPALHLLKAAVQVAKGAAGVNAQQTFMNNAALYLRGEKRAITSGKGAVSGASLVEDMQPTSETGTGMQENAPERDVVEDLTRRMRRSSTEQARTARDLKRTKQSQRATAEEAAAVAKEAGVVAGGAKRTFELVAEKRRKIVTPQGKAAQTRREVSGTPKTESEAKAAVIRENAEAITDDEVNELADSDLAAAVRRAKSIAERGERSTISTTAGKVLGRIQFSPRMPAAARVLMGDTMRRMRKLVSDVPLHVQDEATFYEDYARKKAANNEPIHVLPRAYYDPNTDEIFVRQDRQDDPGDLLHEMTHAAYDRVLDLNPEVRADIRQLMKAVDAQLDKEAGERGEFHYNIPYGLTNEHEFLTEAWTNPDFQKTLARTQLTPEVSKSFGMPAGISAWHALLRSIRQYLFPNGGQAQITALEAIIRKTAEIDAVATRYQQAAQQGQVIREAAAGSRTARVADRLSDERAATPGRFRKLMKLATAHQLEQLYDRHFTGLNGPIERLNRARDALRKTAQDSIQDGNVHAERFLKMQSADPEEAAKTARLANRITKANVNMVNDATAGMPELLAANPHLGGPKSDRMNNFQSRAELPVLHREFMALKPESRQWMMDAADYFRKTQNRNTKAVVGKLLSAIRGDLTVQQLADLQQHTITGKLTEEDRELLGNDDLYNGLVRAQEFRLVDGMYFPLMRHGDHVVTTRSKIGDLHGGVVDGDIIEFTGVKDSVVRKMAKAFLAAQATRGAEKIEATGFGIKRRLLDGTEVSEIDARGHPHTISYRFRLQTQGTYFFESARLAEAFRREHIDAGTFDQISQVRPRKQLHEADQLTSGAMRGILSALDKRTDIDKGDAAYLKGLLQEASVRQLAGNRFQQRALPRRNVRGESENMARNIADYVTASSHAYARTRHMDGIRGILKEMEDFNSTRGMAADAPQREAVVQELVKRSEQSYQDHAGQPDWVRNAMVLSYLYRLFSPAHSIINGTQPWAVTMPILAGRHGVVRTVAALTRAYNTVGGAGIIGSGLYNTAKAGGGLGKISIDTTDIIGSSRKLIGQADDGTFLLKAVDNAIANGKIEDNAGQEVVSAVGAGKGAFGRSLARVDRAARQMPISVEALNRLSTVVAAARLAKSDGMTDEQAIKYSFDMLMQTQGDYSLQNNPAFFSHPIASIGLQFKKYSLMMGNLLADTIRRSFKGATPQERRIAQKQFMGILGVQMAVAGAFSLPGLELLKVGFMISAALGLTDGWDDQERKLRRIFDNAFGKGWGEKLTKGVLSRSMGPLSVDLSQRMSLSDLLFFGEPKDYDNDGIMAYLARLAFGAPAGMVLDWRQGIEMAGDGDYDKAIAKMLPIAFLSNIAKAVRGRVNRDITDTEAVMQAVGFRSGRMAEQGEKIGADIAQSKKLDKEASLLKRQYIEAGPRGLAAIRQRIDEHNRAVEEIQKARAAERVDGKPSNKGKVYTKGLDAIRKDKDAKRAVLQGD